MKSRVRAQESGSRRSSRQNKLPLKVTIILLALGVCAGTVVWLVSMEPRRKALERFHALHGSVNYLERRPGRWGSFIRTTEKRCFFGKNYLTSATQHLRRIEEIAFGYARLTDNDLVLLLEFPELRDLGISSADPVTRVTDAGMESISQLQNLDYLCLEKTPITDRGLVHLQALPRLRRLNLSSTKITGRGFLGFKSADTLEELDLSFCENLTDEGLLELRNFKNLRILNLWVCDNLEGPGYAVFSELKNLQELHLCYVPDPSLKRHFAHVPKVIIDVE